MKPTDEVYYRYVDGRYAALLDEYDFPCGESTPYLCLHIYRVIKHTPKGVWLEGNRFVRTVANKRFACPTQAEALQSFIARKRRQIRILTYQLETAKRSLTLAERPKAEQMKPHESIT